MTEPWDDQVVGRALAESAGGFSPAWPLGPTRARLLARLRRRRLLRGGLAGAATLALVVVMVIVGGALAAPDGTRSRQVAARGADRNGAASRVTTTPGAGTTTGSVAVAPRAPPSGVVNPGTRGTTTVPPPVPVTTSATATTPSTSPGVTSPGATATTTVVAPPASAVRGTVLFKPVCPVERVPPDPACAPRPGAAHIDLLRADGSVAAEGDAGSNGQFAIPVAPGSYTVQAVAASPTPSIGGGCVANPGQVVVKAGAASVSAVSCDTGIR